MRKRNRTISIRVTEQEYKTIQKKIQASQQTQQSFILNAIEGAAILTAKDSKMLNKGYQRAIGGFIEADKGYSRKYQPAGV